MVLDDFPYKVLLKCDNTDTDHVDDWCETHFGMGDYKGRWTVHYANDSPYNYDLIYYFKEEKDAILFTLRWL